MRQWVRRFGFLICPGELSDLVKFGLFRRCLHEGTVLPIYRDEYLDIHERLKVVDKVRGIRSPPVAVHRIFTQSVSILCAGGLLIARRTSWRRDTAN